MKQKISSWAAGVRKRGTGRPASHHFTGPGPAARIWRALGLSLLVLVLGACDPTAISELEEGLSTEADVVERFGRPERVWAEPDGSRTFEYNRQPEGVRNYMITIGPDGVMSALRQVLTPQNFALVQPGMDEQQIRRMFGKPARQVFYELRQEWVWTWKFLDPPSDRKAFYVVFDPQRRVLRTETGPDPDGPDMRGGA